MNINFTQLFFWGIVLQAIGATFALWLMYWVTKAAIREGIKESGIVEALKESRREPTMEGTTTPMTLRAMR